MLLSAHWLCSGLTIWRSVCTPSLKGIPTRSLPTTLEADDTTAAWAVPSSKLPYSGIAAVFLAGTDAFQLRSYVQKSDNTIQEYMWNGVSNHKFLLMSFSNLQLRQRLGGGHQPGNCVPGTGIGATSFRYTDYNGPSIRYATSICNPEYGNTY